jgi:hypothetical protein
MKGFIRSRQRRPALLAAVALAVFGMGVPGAAAKAPAGGTITWWATPTTGGASDVVIAGAIGDYGDSHTIDQSGEANPDGNYAKVKLQKGTFRLDLTAFNAAGKKASFPFVSKAGCSSSGAITAPVGISAGTGLYKGISGRGRFTLTLVWILSQSTSGKCDGSKVLFQSQYLNGAGTVSFS